MCIYIYIYKVCIYIYIYIYICIIIIYTYKYAYTYSGLEFHAVTRVALKQEADSPCRPELRGKNTCYTATFTGPAGSAPSRRRRDRAEEKQRTHELRLAGRTG